MSSGPAHALIRSLRRTGEEAQLTRAIVALAQADSAFANALMSLLLGSATSAPAHALITSADPATACDGERQLFDRSGKAVGRVDLVFRRGEITLFVEVKLHSDYGLRQLDRYMRGIRPEQGQYLLAITRNISHFIEPAPNTQGWLGSVRWAHLVPRLRKLAMNDRLKPQWELLLDVLEDDGDMGSTKITRQLVNAYEKADTAWERLTDFLEQVGTAVLPLLRLELAGGGSPKRSLAAFAQARERRPPKANRGRPDVDRDRPEVISDDEQLYLAFKIPARGEERLWVGFYVEDGTAWFYIAAGPAKEKPSPAQRVQWTKASEALRPLMESKRFFCNEGDDLYVQLDYPLADFVKSPDVPRDLAARVEEDLPLFVRAGLFS
jgi:hypothetical protein